MASLVGFSWSSDHGYVILDIEFPRFGADPGPMPLTSALVDLLNSMK